MTSYTTYHISNPWTSARSLQTNGIARSLLGDLDLYHWFTLRLHEQSSAARCFHLLRKQAASQEAKLLVRVQISTNTLASYISPRLLRVKGACLIGWLVSWVRDKMIEIHWQKDILKQLFDESEKSLLSFVFHDSRCCCIWETKPQISSLLKV